MAAAKSSRAEPQLWDFKETLTAWHATGATKQNAKTTFAEDVAGFANAEGGVLVVGVTDERKMVGVGSGRELESRLKFAADILAERLDYPRKAYQFCQVSIPSDSGPEVICLVVAAAKLARLSASATVMATLAIPSVVKLVWQGCLESI